MTALLRRSVRVTALLALCIALALGSLGAVPAAAATPPAPWAVLDLGVLPGATESSAVAINDLGHAVGNSGGHAFLWRDGVMTDLGAFTAVDLNNHDQVVGNAGEHALLWQNGATTDLGAFTVRDINDRGQIVGIVGPPFSGGDRAVLWQAGTLTSLGIPSPYLNGTSVFPAAINELGQIAAAVRPAAGGGAVELYLWQDGAYRLLPTSAFTTFPADINDRGVVVGSSRVRGTFAKPHPFAYAPTPDAGVGLGSLAPGPDSPFNGGPYCTPGSAPSGGANAVNNKNEVVGANGTTCLPGGVAGPVHAWVVQADGGGMEDLNALIPADAGWELTSAADINESTQIVGLGQHAGQWRAVLVAPRLTPGQLCALTRQTVARVGLANGMCNALARITRRQDDGVSQGTAQLIGAYKKLVTAAERAGALSGPQASLLTTLAERL